MTRKLVEVGVALRALPGESESGDRCVVKLSENRALVGVIDGLGHGPEAAKAARAAAEVVEKHADESLGSLMRRCHERLRSTRGAAITLMAVDRRTGLLEWVGAGNVAAALFRIEPWGKLRCKELIVRGGAAGVRLPPVNVSSTSVRRGDFVAMATDGVRPTFLDGVNRSEPPQQLAERLLAQYQTTQDDASVVVARIQGELA